MKKMLILVVVVSLVAGALFADEAILIDFGLLTAAEDSGQNERTKMDANTTSRGSLRLTPEQDTAIVTSLALKNWEVHLSSSSRTITNMVNSFIQESTSRRVFSGPVMGVRIHFPVENFHSRAFIKPPFEIPAYELTSGGDYEGIDPNAPRDPNAKNYLNTETRFENGYGVVKNVGTIRSIAVNVYGLNFPHGLWTHIIDGEGNEKSMFMGFLNFDGWGQLRWDNPQYIQEVRNRDLRLYPLYPDSMPFIKFAGFEIKRDAAHKGGDFITYFKDVRVIFDRAVIEGERDIDDETEWGIIQTRENARRLGEMERFGENQVRRYIEGQNQTRRLRNNDDNFTRPGTDINNMRPEPDTTP